MIDSKQFRVGNLVTIDNPVRPIESGEVMPIVGVTETTVRLQSESDDFGQLLKFIKPIPLTEEWLIKFGFEKTYEPDSPEWDISLNLGSGQVLFLEYPEREFIDVGVKRSDPKKEREDFCYFKDIRYIHDLQNLFFALTDEELITKEDNGESIQ